MAGETLRPLDRSRIDIDIMGSAICNHRYWGCMRLAEVVDLDLLSLFFSAKDQGGVRMFPRERN